jgi:hypothetical protein
MPSANAEVLPINSACKNVESHCNETGAGNFIHVILIFSKLMPATSKKFFSGALKKDENIYYIKHTK